MRHGPGWLRCSPVVRCGWRVMRILDRSLTARRTAVPVPSGALLCGTQSARVHATVERNDLAGEVRVAEHGQGQVGDLGRLSEAADWDTAA